ncbi:sugar phosphate isomerase/epimerase family protein [Domibacillus robiginosus]|uniref:sugar phosphate isomerase/epimerase family protein n=1 Tax=Domibacillus robiginosus TaxID=1071054 RepID=UPI00067BE872|nr:sugar phosphate isomerase/epimerase [Domibacillus robiginosus]
MKLAYPFLTEETKKPLLGYKGDIKDALSKLKGVGYSGVELLTRNPEEIDISMIHSLIQRLDLQIAAVGTGPVVSDDRLTFTAKNRETRAAAVERAKKIVDFASQFDCPVSIGKLRGEIDKENTDQSWAWMKEGFEQTCEYAQKVGIEVAIEPQSRTAMNNLHTTLDALSFLESMNLPNLKLMLDVYHMNIEGESTTESFKKSREQLIYLHIADSSRKAPGKGTFEFEKVIQSLISLNYKGFITPEINQGEDSYSEAKDAFEFLIGMIKERNRA